MSNLARFLDDVDHQGSSSNDAAQHRVSAYEDEAYDLMKVQTAQLQLKIPAAWEVFAE